MRKDDYLNILSVRLNVLPAEEYRDIMEYYKEYFEEAGEENEEKVINELGDANELAERIIKENMGEGATENSTSSRLYTSNIELNEDKEKLYGNENQLYNNQNGIYTQMNAPYGQNNQPYTQPNGQPYVPYVAQNQGLSTGWKVVIAILTCPIWMGLLTGVLGVIAGFGIASLACFCSGIAVIIAGIVTVATSVATSIMFIGAGFVVMALSFAFLMATVGIAQLVGKIFSAIFGKKEKPHYV